MTHTETIQQVRPGTIEDAEAIAAIGQESFRDTFGELFLKQEDMEDYLAKTYTTERVAQSFGNDENQYFIGLVNGEAAGFANLKKTSKHPALPQSKQCELQRIYVRSSFHGWGIGQQLMDAIIAAAEQTEAEVLWLDVYVDNRRAQRFYERNGFSKGGDHRFTIGSQEFLYDVFVRPIR